MYQNEFKRYVRITGKLALCIIVFSFFFLYTQKVYSQYKKVLSENFFDSKTIIVGHTSINVKIADSEEERTKGLSGKEKLEERDGMFFIFEKEGDYGFWMKDMKFPIDIIWFDKYGAIIYVEKNVSPDTYPKLFRPNSLALFVLEVNAGFFDTNKMLIGDTLDLI